MQDVISTYSTEEQRIILQKYNIVDYDEIDLSLDTNKFNLVLCNKRFQIKTAPSKIKNAKDKAEFSLIESANNLRDLFDEVLNKHKKINTNKNNQEEVTQVSKSKLSENSNNGIFKRDTFDVTSANYDNVIKNVIPIAYRNTLFEHIASRENRVYENIKTNSIKFFSGL